MLTVTRNLLINDGDSMQCISLVDLECRNMEISGVSADRHFCTSFPRFLGRLSQFLGEVSSS